MSVVNETLSRQWSMLRKLPRYPHKITARELTEYLIGEGYEVSKRTIERDLVDLSATFPLMQDDRERPYGWSWQKNAPAFDLPGLDEHESLMLMMVEQHLQDMLPPSTVDVMAPYFKSARIRLASTNHRSQSKHWTEVIRAIPPAQPLLPPKIDAEVHRITSEALLHERQLQIRYRKRGESSDVEYRAHPLGLVQRGPVLYLCARLFDYEDMRLLALHRVTHAKIMNEKAIIPENFDLDSEINQGKLGFGNGETIQLEAIFSASHGEHLYETPLGYDQQIESLADGKLCIKVTVSNTPQLKWWLLAMGNGVEVIAPQNLRQQLITTIRQMARVYDST